MQSLSRRIIGNAQRHVCSKGGFRHASTASTPKPVSRKIFSLVGAVGFAGLVYVLVPTRSNVRVADKLSTTTYTPSSLTSTEISSPHSKLLKLTLPPSALPAREDISSTPVYSFYIKDADLQIERPYTPLYGLEEDGSMTFWVRRYDGGEVSSWLHRRKVGDEVEVRGPIPTWTWKEGEYDEIFMISGGTGITPFYQLLHDQSSRPPSSTHFTLLHSSPTPKDLPPAGMLDALRAQSDRVSLRLFVDFPSGQSDPKDLQVRRIGKADILDALRSRGLLEEPSFLNRLRGRQPVPSKDKKRILFLVCGPEPMIAALAGPRTRNLEQGRVGGVLGELGYGAEEVFKL